MPRSILREMVPTEVIERGLRAIGIPDLASSCWVSERHFSQDAAGEWAVEVRPYYFPCMAKLYMDYKPVDYKMILTLLRHCLKHLNRNLVRRERCERVEVNTYKYFPEYKLTLAPIPEGGAVVGFP